MKPEIKQMWIDALLSGEYLQGHGHLCNFEDGTPYWCCLGVLSDLAVKSGVQINVHFEDTANALMFYDEQSEKLPKSIMEWSGIESNLGEFLYKDGYDEDTSDTLAELNDNGVTFEDLAQLIEDHF